MSKRSAAEAAASSNGSDQDDVDARKADDEEHKLDGELEEEFTHNDTSSRYSGEFTAEELRRAGFEEQEQVEDSLYCRRREPQGKKWSEGTLDVVWARGCILTGSNIALCYICERSLVKERRQCKCSHRKACICGAWEVEHVLAKHVDHTGRHVLGNLLPSCAACNSGTWKGSDTLVQLVKKKGISPCMWAADCANLLTETLLEIRAAIALGNDLDKQKAAQENDELRVLVAAQRKLNNLQQSDLTGNMDHWVEVESGGFGFVYQTTLVTGEPVAVKYIDTTQATKELSFQREVLCLSAISGHPNVPKLHGSFMTEAGGFIVLEFFKSDLHKASKAPTRGHLDYLVLMRDVAKAIAHLKANNYLHRDCKLGNILLRGPPYKQAVLADFGESRIPAERMSRKAGTAGYRAPEMHSEEYGHEVDVLSFGKTLSVLRQRLTDDQIKMHASWMDACIKFCTLKNRYQRPLIEQVVAALDEINTDASLTTDVVLHALNTDATANKIADMAARKQRVLEKKALMPAIHQPAVVAGAVKRARSSGAPAINASAAAAPAGSAAPAASAVCCHVKIKSGPRKTLECGRARPCRYHK